MRRDSIYFWGVHGVLLLVLIFSWFKLNLVFGFVLTASIAALAIFHNNKINRRRATIDLIMKFSSDNDLNVAKETVAKLTSDNLTAIASKAIGSSHDGDQDPTDTEREQIKCTLRLLNWYEFVATGIREGAFDYKMFHRMCYSVTCRDWKKLHVFVVQLRSPEDASGTSFQEFEWLANNFKNHKLKRNFKNQ